MPRHRLWLKTGEYRFLAGIPERTYRIRRSKPKSWCGRPDEVPMLLGYDAETVALLRATFDAWAEKKARSSETLLAKPSVLDLAREGMCNPRHQPVVVERLPELRDFGRRVSQPFGKDLKSESDGPKLQIESCPG